MRADIPAGAAANAIACTAAGIATRVPGLIASRPTDTEGRNHYALPWAGCSIVTATEEQLQRIRERGIRDDTEIVVMPRVAQETRVFAEVEEAVSQKPQHDLLAVSLSGRATQSAGSSTSFRYTQARPRPSR